MVRRVPILIIAIASVASAQPRPRPSAAKVPMRPVPCVPQDSTLHTNGTDAIVCWDKGCMKLDFQSTDASWIVKPPELKRWQMPRAEVKADQVCLGATCKKLGKKLIAALALANRDHDASAGLLNVAATGDLKAVVIGGDQVWSVAGDAQLKLATPKLYARTGEKPMPFGIDVAGNLLVVGWSACAGPCTKFSIADSSGRPKGPEGEGGGEVFQLDAKRFVVTSEYATLSVFDIATGKARGKVVIGAGPERNATVRADDSTMFTMWEKNDGVQVARVLAYDDATIPPAVESSMFLPSCTP